MPLPKVLKRLTPTSPALSAVKSFIRWRRTALEMFPGGRPHGRRRCVRLRLRGRLEYDGRAYAEARTIALVMTLVHEGAAHTVAFDGASRSMMWLCPGRVETQRRALASVEATDDDVVLKPTIGQSLFLETGEEVSLASLEECTEAFLLFIQIVMIATLRCMFGDLMQVHVVSRS